VLALNDPESAKHADRVVRLVDGCILPADAPALEELSEPSAAHA
jgi:hypothetical protein